MKTISQFRFVFVVLSGILLSTFVVLFVWQRSNSRERVEVPESDWPVWDVAFSTDGQWLAAARGYQDSAYMWGGVGAVDVWRTGQWPDTQQWTRHTTLSGLFTDRARSVAFAPDSMSLLVASDVYDREGKGDPFRGNQVFQWKWPEGHLTNTLHVPWANPTLSQSLHIPEQRPAGFVTSLALSPEGELVVLAFSGAPPLILNRENGRLAYQIAGGELGKTFSPDGKTLLSPENGHGFQEIMLFDASNGKQMAKLTLGGAKPMCARYSPDGKRVAVGASDGSIRLFAPDLTKQIQSIVPPEQKDPIVAVAFSADGKFLAGATQHFVYLISAYTGELIRQWEESDNCVRAIAFSPDNSVLAAGYGRIPTDEKPRPSGGVKVWSTPTGRLVKQI